MSSTSRDSLLTLSLSAHLLVACKSASQCRGLQGFAAREAVSTNVFIIDFYVLVGLLKYVQGSLYD